MYNVQLYIVWGFSEIISSELSMAMLPVFKFKFSLFKIPKSIAVAALLFPVDTSGGAVKNRISLQVLLCEPDKV